MDNFWEFHEWGNSSCKACVNSPMICYCGRGLVHTHYDLDLLFLESWCDTGHDVEFLELPTPIGVQNAS